MRTPSARLALTLLFLLLMSIVGTACAEPPAGSADAKADADLPRPAELSGDPVSTLLPPDAIPAIDDPRFVAAAEASLEDDEPVVGLVVGGEARAYSLWHLDRHEIVNDVVGGEPLAVTW